MLGRCATHSIFSLGRVSKSQQVVCVNGHGSRDPRPLRRRSGVVCQACLLSTAESASGESDDTSPAPVRAQCPSDAAVSALANSYGQAPRLGAEASQSWDLVIRSATEVSRIAASPASVDILGFDGPALSARPVDRPDSMSCSWFFVMPAWYASASWESPRAFLRSRKVSPRRLALFSSHTRQACAGDPEKHTLFVWPIISGLLYETICCATVLRT